MEMMAMWLNRERASRAGMDVGPRRKKERRESRTTEGRGRGGEGKEKKKKKKKESRGQGQGQRGQERMGAARGCAHIGCQSEAKRTLPRLSSFRAFSRSRATFISCADKVSFPSFFLPSVSFFSLPFLSSLLPHTHTHTHTLLHPSCPPFHPSNQTQPALLLFFPSSQSPMIGIQRKETSTDMDPQDSPSSARIDPKAAAAAIVAASDVAVASATLTNGNDDIHDTEDTDKVLEEQALEMEHEEPSSPSAPPMLPALDPIKSLSVVTDPSNDSKEKAPADALQTSAASAPASDRDQPQPAAGSEDQPGQPESKSMLSTFSISFLVPHNHARPQHGESPGLIHVADQLAFASTVIIIGTKTKLKRPTLRSIDLGSTPSKSILRKESSYPFIEQPVRNPIFKSQWLQSTVSKLAVISGPAIPTAYTADQPSMFRKLVAQATAATQATPGSPSTTPGSSPQQRLQRTNSGPPVFANNERRPLLESHDSSSSILSTKALKRVRFSVGQLTTEHVFHQDDAYESAEEIEPRPVQINTVVQPKELMTTSDGVVVDDNIYTAKEIMNYYLAACNNREEFPVDRLVSEMRSASSRQSNPLLTTIDLTGTTKTNTP